MYLSIAFILRQREEMTTGLLIYSTTKQNCISPNVFMNVKFTLIAFEEGKRQTANVINGVKMVTWSWRC